MKNQLNRGLQKRLMYVENKDGDIDGVAARIGWVTFFAPETHRAERTTVEVDPDAVEAYEALRASA